MIHALIAATLLQSPTPDLVVKVDGPGLMRYVRDGRAVYAKSANLIVRDGKLVTASGLALLPSVSVPTATDQVLVSLDGTLSVKRSDKPFKIGQLVLALFDNENSLVEDNGYLIARERPQLSDPGTELSGVIRTVSPARSTDPAPKPIAAKALQVIAPYKAAQMGAAVVAQPKPSAMPSIVIRTQAEVSGDRFSLGDIGTVLAEPELKAALEDVPVGESPVIGVVRGVDQPSVVAALSRAGFKSGSYSLTFPVACRVKRKSQEVPDEQFVKVARQAIQEQCKTTIPLRNEVAQPAMALPLGEVSLKPELVNHMGRGFMVAIGVYVDGKRINARLVQMGADKDAVSVSAGQALKVILRLNGASVETPARAKETGYVGQEIGVETSTGATLRGIVLANGSVEVRL